MRRVGYILPLVISGCQGETAGLTSNGDAASADLLRILTQGQARADFPANFAAVRNLGVTQWVQAARGELSDATVVIDGQTFTNLRSELQFTPTMLNSLVGINQTFRSLATIMRMYGAQNAAKISADDVTDYMKLAAAGLNYARGGSFTLNVAPAAWLRAFNVGFALTAAAHDSVESPLAAATTNGLFFAFYRGFLNPPTSANLALGDISPDGCDNSADWRTGYNAMHSQSSGKGWSRCGTALALLATVTNNNGGPANTSPTGTGSNSSGLCGAGNQRTNNGPTTTNNNNGGTNNNNNGGSNNNNNDGSTGSGNTNNNGVEVTGTAPLSNGQ